MWGHAQKLGLISWAVLTLIGYKQTDKQRTCTFNKKVIIVWYKEGKTKFKKLKRRTGGEEGQGIDFYLWKLSILEAEEIQCLT